MPLKRHYALGALVGRQVPQSGYLVRSARDQPPSARAQCNALHSAKVRADLVYHVSTRNACCSGNLSDMVGERPAFPCSREHVIFAIFAHIIFSCLQRKIRITSMVIVQLGDG